MNNRRRNHFAEGVYLVSLGCPKNLVDSEVMAGCLVSGGVPLNFDASSAQYYLINTCAFLPSAREESARAIQEGIRWKKQHPEVRKLIVAGCLIQQDQSGSYKEKFPEVDAWSGVDGVPEILRTLENAGDGRRTGDTAAPCYLYDENTPRLQLTLPHVAYLKIADGCNNRCAYCSIPLIRGELRSRSMASVIAEARNLLAGGVRELIVIAQDVTVYGVDRSDGATLAGLLHELDRLEGDFRIRLLYTHPAHYTDEFLAEYGRSKHVLPYLDIPLQHINDSILLKMGRKVGRHAVETVLAKIRAARPETAIRTTFITGLPGEGDAEFAELVEFVSHERFARLGVFAYSPEPGTPAASFTPRVAGSVAEARAGELLDIQRKIALEANRALIGKTMEVICDEADGRRGRGRTFADAPEIDNAVIFTSARRLSAGEYYNVRITDAKTFDLYGEVC